MLKKKLILSVTSVAILSITFISCGSETVKEVEVIRKKINIPSVPYYKELKNKVGYIKLNSFTDKASRDVKKAFDELLNIKDSNRLKKIINW